MEVPLTSPCLAVLRGRAALDWAAEHFSAEEIVDARDLEGLQNRLDGLVSCVVNAEGLSSEDVDRLRRAARSAGVARILVLVGSIDTPPSPAGWDGVIPIDPLELSEVVVRRVPLAVDRRDDHGPFDIVGDVHGCIDELERLLEALGYDEDGSHPAGRRLIFTGDLVDRGPSTLSVLRKVLPMLGVGRAMAVPGNHDHKFDRWLRGHDVRPSGGLETTTDEWKTLSDAEQREMGIAFCALVGRAPPYLWLDQGRLLVSHAGLEEADHGRVGNRVHAFCLYGKVKGQPAEGEHPLRLDWARDYSGRTAVVHGHVPVLSASWRNNTADIDLGCVFGGSLCAVRWPERDFVEIPAERAWWPHDEPPSRLEARNDALPR